MKPADYLKAIQPMKTQLPATLHDLHNSCAFQRFIESKLGNDLFISDPDRAERIHDSAQNGADGSTNAEHIEDWRECLKQIKDDAMREAFRAETEDEGEGEVRAIEAWAETIEAEIAKCEDWHKDNGSLHEEIG